MEQAGKQTKVAVLGFGLEGRATIDYLFKHGIKPVLFDQSPANSYPTKDLNCYLKKCSGSHFGKNAFSALRSFTRAYKSPGIPYKQLKNLPKSLSITSQTADFLSRFSSQTVGVTGTKGKGTTSTLVYQMLKEDGRKVHLTGNIGKTQAFELMDGLGKEDIVVMELSSFQLREVTKSPRLAIVLMTTSEHLDWHQNTRDYQRAKSNIARHQQKGDLTVVNSDYPGSAAIGRLGKAEKIFFSTKKRLPQGCYADGKGIYLKNRLILPISQVKLRGRHNLENACAAAAAAAWLKCKISSIRKTLKTFSGLPHRLEKVAEKRGVAFYNDSFSTTPETAVAAMRSFWEPLVVILGGSSKNSDFSILAKEVAKHNNIRGLVLMGEESSRILAALKKEKVNLGLVREAGSSFSKAFSHALALSRPGDVVLLSPACASFDMFKNYRDRGERFKAVVEKIHD